jgi:hypothetical protein
MPSQAPGAMELPRAEPRRLGTGGGPLVRQDEATSLQEVQFRPRQGLATQRESSLALPTVTTVTKRRQSDRQATTRVKRISPVTAITQMPTVSVFGKALCRCGSWQLHRRICRGRSAWHAGKQEW